LYYALIVNLKDDESIQREENAYNSLHQTFQLQMQTVAT